ncbi:MAG TPA: hypothetical protein VF905_11775 [Nitrospirota bacterium]
MIVKNEKLKLKWKTYFVLKAIPPGNVPGELSDQIERNELYLGADVRLNSPAEMAFIKSRSLAEQFKDACSERLKKRYGSGFDLDIVECSSHENKTIQTRIESDTHKIQKRLTNGNFTRNKSV